MENKHYNKDILEAVTQGKVCGKPTRSYDPFRLVKTTIFFIILLSSIGLCDSPENELENFIEEFNKISPFKLQSSKSWPTKEEAEYKVLKEKDETEAVALNKAEIKEGRYWVDGRWIVRKNSNYRKVGGGWIYIEDSQEKEHIPAKSEQELIDSDNDGYDDYTEHINGTNPQDYKEIPAIRNGKNKVTFKMDGCKGKGFEFPSITKDVLPLEIMSTGAKALDDYK